VFFIMCRAYSTFSAKIKALRLAKASQQASGRRFA
jgi:hypothetical protein